MGGGYIFQRVVPTILRYPVREITIKGKMVRTYIVSAAEKKRIKK